jgi:hypothetical protein
MDNGQARLKGFETGLDINREDPKLLEPISKMHLTPDGNVLNRQKVLTTPNELKLKMGVIVKMW